MSSLFTFTKTVFTSLIHSLRQLETASDIQCILCAEEHKFMIMLYVNTVTNCVCVVYIRFYSIIYTFQCVAFIQASDFMDMISIS